MSPVRAGLVAMILAPLLGGCSHTIRYLSHEHWRGEDILYVAYVEDELTNTVVFGTWVDDTRAHVKLCKQVDNALSCQPLPVIDTLLNDPEAAAAAKAPLPPPLHSEPPPPPAEPLPPPPAEPAAPAEGEDIEAETTTPNPG